MEKDKLPVLNLLLSRSKFVELVIVAVFLGFGISLTSSSITVINGFKPMLGIYIGGLICIISVIYISLKVFVRRKKRYFLLNKLSIHLNSYFKYPMEKNKNISVIQREHIPSVLLSNRFLELFSKPMKDRAAFIDIEQENEEQEWYILDVEGGTFQKFSLVLPYKSKVIRTNKNEIEIKNHKFDINMKVNFDGCNDVLPSGFMEHYLSIHGFENYLANVVYCVEFDLYIKFKITSLLSSFGLKNYNWIDSFFEFN